jgi:cytoskeleton protein RodZ
VTQPPPVLAQAQTALIGTVDPTAIEPAAGTPATALVPAAQALAVPAATIPAVQPARPELKINVTETAWVEVRSAEGRILLSRVLKPGDSYTVPPGPGMLLDTGNIGGLEFVLNGEKLPPLGAKGDVRRKVSLDPAKLIPVQARRANDNPAAAAAAIAPAAGRE